MNPKTMAFYVGFYKKDPSSKDKNENSQLHENLLQNSYEKENHIKIEKSNSEKTIFLKKSFQNLINSSKDLFSIPSTTYRQTNNHLKMSNAIIPKSINKSQPKYCHNFQKKGSLIEISKNGNTKFEFSNNLKIQQLNNLIDLYRPGRHLFKDIMFKNSREPSVEAKNSCEFMRHHKSLADLENKNCLE